MASPGVPVDERRDHARGPAHAPITIVAYGDYQCAFSAEACWILSEIEARFQSDLRYVVRHFPLTEIHPLAMLAAEAAEAAGAQGEFWAMHRRLYRDQRLLDPETLLDLAADLELDLEGFGTDLERHRHRPRVRDDFMIGVRSGVNGTPTMFVNGARFEGPIDAARVIREIEAILEQRGARAES